MAKQTYQPGHLVVYRVLKHSQRPGPRAHDNVPAPLGETYRYQVDKFWVVEAVHDDGTLVVRTRRGKAHQLRITDPNLRHATWWEAWRYGASFPQLSQLNV
jgi:hypothetical protein